MALRFEDKWVWDFWFVRAGGRHHMFYLQAPKTIGDPHQRHWNASIGHAVSDNLVDWEVLPDALHRGEDGAWDDMSTWTGSVLRHGEAWSLLYTGTSTREKGQVQRIGLATSPDLTTWTRHGTEPVIEADARWYEKLHSGLWHDEAWRDPFVFQHESGWFHATITARANHGPAEGRGVVGQARSLDLETWEVLPPLTTPDGFGQTEVTQLIAYAGDWYLVFCSDIPTQSASRRASGHGTGTYYLRADDPLGPFHLTNARPLLADHAGTTYAGRLVERDEGSLCFLAWEWADENGGFKGSISDPYPVIRLEDGELEVLTGT